MCKMNKYKGKVQGIWMLVLLSHIGLCNPMDCILSVHEILQARKLEGVSISFSSGSSWPRDLSWVSCIEGRFFTIWATREVDLNKTFKNKMCEKNKYEGKICSLWIKHKDLNNGYAQTWRWSWHNMPLKRIKILSIQEII